MGTLTGKLIKGTGSYEVKEIAPPVVAGKLFDEDFSIDAGWTKQDGWTISGGYAVTTSAGDNKALIVVGPGSYITAGRRYKFTWKINSMSEGALHLSLGGDETTPRTSAGVYTEYITCISAAYFAIVCQGTTTAQVDWMISEEVPEGYPLLDKGIKYLECTSDGDLAVASDQAYGEWEFDLYKGNDVNDLIVNFIAQDFPYTQGYRIRLYTNEALYIRRDDASAGFETAVSYFESLVWYRFKIIKTLDGVLSLYIMGGDFGCDDWTLVVTSVGSNPAAADNTYTTSTYFVLNFNAGDRISTDITRKAVKQ